MLKLSPKELRQNKDKSPELFIINLCKNFSCDRHSARAHQRRSPEFIEHCIQLYHDQRGLCAISGVKMLYSKRQRDSDQISIDRIDNSRGYEIGNVRLVCLWVNNALADYGLETMMRFVRLISNRIDGFTTTNSLTEPEQNTKTIQNIEPD
jgi:hypothetical protein